MMMSVFRFTNWSARMENEIVMPSSSVMRFASVVLRGLGETVKAAALAQEVAEHQEADERDGHRRDDSPR